MCVFFFKQKTAYEMRISDWSSDVCSSDLSLIFADAATGPHSPALASQGRIAAVIAARPQERRAMLEEAAGISGLHVRRKDAEQKLRAAEANLMRLDEIPSDMDAPADAPRRQANAADRDTRHNRQSVGQGRRVSGEVDLGG